MKIDTKARKTPRQERAKATLDAILHAAAQVLVAHGYDKTTTARVAERAGVSIGSLYQYFPNKQALVAALIERHADEIVAIIARALADQSTLDAGMRALIAAAMDAHRLDPALHKILHEQIPRVSKLGKAMDTSRRIRLLIERFLEAHRRALPAGLEPALAAEVIEVALEALGHHAIIHRRPALEAWERETYRVVSRYLARA